MQLIGNEASGESLIPALCIFSLRLMPHSQSRIFRRTGHSTIKLWSYAALGHDHPRHGIRFLISTVSLRLFLLVDVDILWLSLRYSW